MLACRGRVSPEVGKKRGRSLWQRALAVLFVVVATPLVLAAAVRSPAVREYARQEAKRAIAAELGLVAIIEDVDIEPKSLALVARGITMDHPRLGRFVEAKHLRIRPSWWALLRGRVDLHTITIDKASVWLVFRDGKLVNGPATKPSASGEPSVDLPFDKLWVKRSNLFVDAQPDARGHLPNIDIYLDFRRIVIGHRRVKCRLRIEGAAGRVNRHRQRRWGQRLEGLLWLTGEELPRCGQQGRLKRRRGGSRRFGGGGRGDAGGDGWRGGLQVTGGQQHSHRPYKSACQAHRISLLIAVTLQSPAHSASSGQATVQHSILVLLVCVSRR